MFTLKERLFEFVYTLHQREYVQYCVLLKRAGREERNGKKREKYFHYFENDGKEWLQREK